MLPVDDTLKLRGVLLWHGLCLYLEHSSSGGKR